MSERVTVDVHNCQQIQDEVPQHSHLIQGSYNHNEVVEKTSKNCSRDQRDDNSRCSEKGSTALATGTGSRQVGMVPNNLKDATNDRMESDKPDVFFSYSSKDREWVHQTASRLETEHGIVCSYDNRDFVGGKTITSNIMKCIQICRKTVLIISPNFLSSPWCEYEMQMVLREHLFREQKVVIPVVLHDCIIPDFISHLTYLEVKDPQFWEKFLEILKSDSTEEGGLAEIYSFGYETDKFNGKAIAQANTTTSYLSPTYDSSRIHQTLSSRGIRVTLEDVDGAVKAMRGGFLRRCFCCFFCCQSRSLNICRIACIAATVWVFIPLFLLLFLTISDREKVFPVNTTGQLCIASALVFCFTAFLVSLFGSYFVVKRIRRKVETAANLQLLDHNIIVGYIRTNRWTGEQALQVVSFKSAKCLDTLQRYLRDKKKPKDSQSIASSIEDGAANDRERDDTDIAPLIDVSDMESATKETAKMYVAEICGDYIRKLNDQKLRNPGIGQRHTRQGVCLCQYVISERFKELV